MRRRAKGKRPTYVLGTGLSHDGSACLLRDGQVAVAIEKERITRIKHDGGNDTAAIRYCLDTEGIAIEDLALVVQNGLFGDFSRGDSFFEGPRLLRDGLPVPIVTISHHLAHAYSAIGMCPFPEAAILVIDGCGNALDECTDLQGQELSFEVDEDMRHLYFEKDSYYLWREGRLRTVFKDFSPWGSLFRKHHPLALTSVTKHSIGGVYAAASHYCVRGTSDLGKLMGLAPYGREGVFTERIFELRDGRLFVADDWMRGFDRPARTAEDFKRDFQYYADVACWVQREVERALLYLVQARYEMCPASDLAYAGGVALNAVANARILQQSSFRQIYMVPAAGDNGVALGCAFYGWIEVLGRERVPHSGSTCFGRSYGSQGVAAALRALAGEKLAPAPTAADTADPAEQIEGLLWGLQKGLKPALAGAWSTKFRWEVAGATTFATEVRDGRLYVTRDVMGPVTAVIRGDAATIAGVLQGRFHPARIVERGRLQCTNLLALLFFHAGIDWQSIAAKQAAPSPWNLCWESDADPVGRAAQLLADGKVIAWFQGGSEFGPRALGRRSILADPRKPGVVDLINVRVKRREEFRPFAPSVLWEDAPTYFECDVESPYMILVAQVRERWREILGSVSHRDGSARLQTVTPDWNPRYHALLTACKRLTGLPVLLNTSFNRKGMPIVETPEEAINFFREADGLDALVIEDFVLERREAMDLWSPHAERQAAGLHN